MAENDDIIGAILFAIEMLVRQARWDVEPSGGSKEEGEAAKFVKSCMHDMQTGWQDTISEILSFLVYGWSYHEIVYKRRMGKHPDPKFSSGYDDGLIGWRKLPIRCSGHAFKVGVRHRRRTCGIEPDRCPRTLRSGHTH